MAQSSSERAFRSALFLAHLPMYSAVMQCKIRHASRIPVILCIALLVIGCLVPELRVTDIHGCILPSAVTFRKVGIDASLTQSIFGKILIGELKLSEQPEVISLISAVRAYHRCLVIRRDHYTLEQATYLEQMYLFERTHPTAKQFQEWQGQNPFPKTPVPPEVEYITSVVLQYFTADDNKDADENISAVITMGGLQIGQGGPWGGGEEWGAQEYLNNGQPHIFEIPLNNVATDLASNVQVETIKSRSKPDGGHTWSTRIKYGYRTNLNTSIRWSNETGIVKLGGRRSVRYTSHF